MSLHDKVQTWLEATLEESVRKVAHQVYEEKYGNPLKDLLSTRRYDMEEAVSRHIKDVTNDLLKTDDELRNLIREQLRQVLATAFAPKIEVVQ